MRACTRCFATSTWPANASPPDFSAATCDFGHGYSNQTWLTSAWVDSISELLEVYEKSTDPGADELHICIQRDWGVFTLEESQVLAFLRSTVPGHELLEEGVRVRLRSSADGEDLPDHLSSWSAFSDEIRTRNRYFPKAVPDLVLLEQVLLESVSRIDTDVELFRARICEGEPLASTEMGAPPANLTPPGRANPVGIPYLYLAYSRDTCIAEARATTLTTLALGSFHPVRKLTVLNLADIEPPDFFALVEVESTAAQVKRVAFHRYLTALGNELKKPIRSSDRVTDYIPTQYLCELAKAIGLDGVLYSSSADPDGRNVVLFDGSSASCDQEPELVEVTSVEVHWSPLAVD